MTDLIPSRERRRDVRHDKPMSLAIYDDGRELLDDRPALVNISSRGMGFETNSQLIPGETFLFRLQVPGDGVITGKATARWVTTGASNFTYLCGAEIEAIGKSEARILRQCIEPSAFRWPQLFDMALAAAVVIVWYMVSNNLQVNAPEVTSGISSWVQSTFEWLPQLLVVCAAMAGIAVYLKR